MSTERCAMTPLVDGHFEGGLDLQAERRLREHLPGCAICSERYGAQLLLDRLDPTRPGPQARLGAALGLTRRRSRLLTLWAPLLGSVAATAALLLVLLPGTGLQGPATAGYTARGAGSPGAARPALGAFRLLAGRPPAEAERLQPGARIRSSDELAFTYVNPEARRYLMVFAIDRSGEVRWYHPAWMDPGQNPRAIAIRPSHMPVELPSAVSHRLTPGPVRIEALFLDRPMTVKEIEARLKQRQDGGTGALPAPSLGLPLEVVDGQP